MGFLNRSARSHRDYADAWDYTAGTAGEEAADQLLRGFDDKVRLLSDFPHLGRARPELRPRLRSFPVGDYLIFYRPIRGGLELVRVLHGARNLRDVFKRGGG